MTFYGLGIPLVVFALMTAWIAKLAERRGRLGLVWALVGAGAGIAGAVVGVAIIMVAIDADPSTGLVLLAMITPLVLMLAAMGAVAIAVMRLPISTSSRRFTIHEMGRNTAAGTLVVDADRLTIELPGSTDTVLLVALRRAEADGECIRLAWEAGEASVERTYLMGGNPNTPEGRKQQSKVLARRLVVRSAPIAQVRR